MRVIIGESKVIAPSTNGVGPMGASPDLPLTHFNASYVRSAFRCDPISVPAGPRPDEIVFAPGMAKGPRVHSRIGGLEAWQIKGEDGLRRCTGTGMRKGLHRSPTLCSVAKTSS